MFRCNFTFIVKAVMLLALVIFVCDFIALKSVIRTRVDNANGDGDDDDENPQGKWWLLKNINLNVKSNEATEKLKEH